MFSWALSDHVANDSAAALWHPTETTSCASISMAAACRAPKCFYFLGVGMARFEDMSAESRKSLKETSSWCFSSGVSSEGSLCLFGFGIPLGRSQLPGWR